MFIVKGIVEGQCVMCDKRGEVLDVEAPDQRIAGTLCVPDFKRLLKAAGATRTAPQLNERKVDEP